MMGALQQAIGRVRAFFHKQQHDSELESEVASHLDLAIEENLRRGMSPQEARRQAMLRFGGVQQAREHHRETRGLPWLDVLGQDLRFSMRTLRRDSAFTIVAVLILALGIGANIAVFSVVNTILLRPLPFPEPQELVRITTSAKQATSGESSRTYSADATAEYRQRNKSFEDVTGYFAFTGPDNFKLMGKGEPVPVTGLLVMDNFFQTLNVAPSMGRLFRAEESLQHAPPVVLVTYPFWKRQLGGDPAIVGQAIKIGDNGTPVTVVGVLPQSFDFGSVFSPGAKIDVFVPYIMADYEDDGNDLALMGRLKPGVTIGQAQAEANMLFPKLDFDLKHPEYKAEYTANLFGMKEYVSGQLRRSGFVLWCAVGLILLIVCVNLSNLLLARAASRSKEFAMRSALGAGRGRLVRQLLTESLVLSIGGAALGLGIAFGVTSYLAHQGSIALPLLSSVRVDGDALVWTLAITVVTALFFGVVPAFRTSGGNLQESLKDSGHGTSAGRKHDRMRAVLVISEVALACVLLVGAGLLLRSFLRVMQIDLGFTPSRAAAVSVDYPGGDSAKRWAAWQEVVRQVSAIPGVEIAGISDNLPMSRNRSWGIAVEGKTYTKEEIQELPGTFVYIVSPGYLKAMGMRLRGGRDIGWGDGPKDEKVVIINKTVARALWPGQDPVGQIASVNGMAARVIGVVDDVRESSAETAAGWQMYLPASQQGPEGAELVVRSQLPPETLAPEVMQTLRLINPGQPATEFKPIQGLVDHAVSSRRFFVMLVGVFAALGMVLAALGIYGVIAYSVTQRTQEIGIRMALGASQGRVQLGVIFRTLQMAIAGIALGTVASLLISRLIASLLFGTSPTDPATFLANVLLLIVVALVAGYIPARRASRIDPMVALRNN